MLKAEKAPPTISVAASVSRRPLCGSRHGERRRHALSGDAQCGFASATEPAEAALTYAAFALAGGFILAAMLGML